LTSVTIGSSVTAIGSYAFGLNSLTSVTIPNSVLTIGEGAFTQNSLTSVTIGTSVTSIGESAFAANSLTSVTIPNSVTMIGLSAFFSNVDLVSLTLGNSVTTIGPYAFSQCGLSSVTIPDSVTLIDDSAFSNNELTSIHLGNSVTTIGPWAFYGNFLTSVTIPSSVTTIGGIAFAANYDLSSVMFEGAAPTTITDGDDPTASLGQGNDPVVSYKDVFDASNVANGFTTPTWRGYATHKIDTSAPTVTINQGSAQADPTGTSPVVFDVVFSKAVAGFGDDDVTLTGTAGATTAHVTGSGANYTVSVSGMTSSGTVIASIPAGAATDEADQNTPASTSTDNTVTYNAPDTTSPTVTINQGSAQADPTATSPIVFDVVFSEPVTGFTDGDVLIFGAAGPTTEHVTGSGADYTVSVSGMTSSGTVSAAIPGGVATDGTNTNAASTSTDNAVTYNAPDTTTPTVTIDQGSSQDDPTGTSPIVFDVVFSEPVTGLTDGDVALSGTAGATTAHVSGSGSTYTVSVSGMTSSGTVTASVPAGAATDGTNLSAASISTDNTVTYNAAVTGLAPTITGLAQVGQTLTAHEGPVSPSDAALAYQWKANGIPIANATASTYKLKAAQAGKTITVTITASKPPLTAQSKTSDATPYVRENVGNPQLKLDQSSASRGGDIDLHGKGLTPGASYRVAIGGTNLGSFTADEYGEINETVTVPGNTKPGIQIVTIIAPNGKVTSTVLVVN
jgi:Leucine Rich Repeat (LRR) protein